VLPAGNADALYIMARQNQQRFEFIFTDLTDRQPGLAAALQALVAAYEASRPYRELRLRGGWTMFLFVNKGLAYGSTTSSLNIACLQ
jgi:hypothetical protein